MSIFQESKIVGKLSTTNGLLKDIRDNLKNNTSWTIIGGICGIVAIIIAIFSLLVATKIIHIGAGTAPEQEVALLKILPVVSTPQGSDRDTTNLYRANPLFRLASWYDEEHCLGCREDLLMANGETLDSQKPICAFNDLPLGTWLKITYKNKTAYCEITDRVGLDRIDLSKSVFQQLADLKVGIIRVKIEKI